jgi:hypothetical protein
LSGFSFDGPAVAYEAILPNFSSFKRPNEGGNVYVDGALKLDEWTAQDGTKLHGFACRPGTHVFSKSGAISRGAMIRVSALLPRSPSWRSGGDAGKQPSGTPRRDQPGLVPADMAEAFLKVRQ